MPVYEIIDRNGYDYEIAGSADRLLNARIIWLREIIKTRLDPDHCVVTRRIWDERLNCWMGVVQYEDEGYYPDGAGGAESVIQI